MLPAALPGKKEPFAAVPVPVTMLFIVTAQRVPVAAPLKLDELGNLSRPPLWMSAKVVNAGVPVRVTVMPPET